MSLIHLLGASGATDSVVQIAKSASFNTTSSQYLARTPSSSGNNKIGTFSTWVYHTPNGLDQTLFAATAGAADIFQLYIDSNDDIILYNYSSGYDWQYVTDMKLRDTGWIHFCCGIDTSQSSAGDRVTLEINGVAVTDFSTSSAPALNFANDFNTSSNPMRVGSYDGSHNFGNNYMAETVWIDGTKYSASNFAEFDSTGLYWTPKSSDLIKALNFGTNGFYLDNTTNAQTDASGQGNNMTNSGSVATSNHTPSNIHAMLSPIDSAGGTVSNGNRTLVTTASADQSTRATLPLPTSGKFYWETNLNVASTSSLGHVMALNNDNLLLTTGNASWTDTVLITQDASGSVKVDGSNLFTFSGTASINDKYQIAVDLDNNKMWFGINNSWFNSSGGTDGNPSTGANPTISQDFSGYYPMFGNYKTNQTVRFDSADWTYTQPSGYVALNTTNIASNTSRTASETTKHFESLIYEGSGSEKNVVSDTTTYTSAFAWVKNRDANDPYMMFDRVRGATKDLHSDQNYIEVTNAQTVKAFIGGGVTLGTDAEVNTSSESYVLWNWMIGTAGSGSSNEDGSINTTATLVDGTIGLSISKYTGTGSAATVGHGLGAVPKLMLIKNLGVTDSWAVYYGDNTDYLVLDTATGTVDDATMWNDTSPTSSVFTIGSNHQVNASSETYIAYCFANSQFISVGSYTGNENANGPFIRTVNSAGVPIQPVWIMVKNTVQARSWNIWDAVRSPYNVSDKVLEADFASTESSGSTYYIDIDTGGFKIRGSHETLNGAEEMIYMAIGTPIIDTAGRIIAGR